MSPFWNDYIFVNYFACKSGETVVFYKNVKIINAERLSIMQLLTEEVKGFVANSSMIRRMFEAGIELKKKYGADKVYDFSLGNPDLPPPPEVKTVLEKIAARADQPFSIGYMPNAGYLSLRQKLAGRLSGEQQVELTADKVLLTCGAAGGLNVVFRAILNAGDEVLVPSPYFVEYDFYVGNRGGKLHKVPSLLPDFRLDLDGFAKAVNEKTRAVILNSPNNPTGQIYSRTELEALADILRAAEKRYGKPIFLLSDEPYRCLNFDSVEIPGMLGIYEHSLVIGSYSKSLSLAGERLGYIALGPGLDEAFFSALTICNRILGFVSAPAIGQQILEEAYEAEIDLPVYRRRRDEMAGVLRDAGVEFFLPRGAFYFFPKSPVAEEAKFVKALMDEQILAVPGGAFGLPGYLRLAFCVDSRTILNSAAGFRRAVAKVRG